MRFQINKLHFNFIWKPNYSAESQEISTNVLTQSLVLRASNLSRSFAIFCTIALIKSIPGPNHTKSIFHTVITEPYSNMHVQSKFNQFTLVYLAYPHANLHQIQFPLAGFLTRIIFLASSSSRWTHAPAATLHTDQPTKWSHTHHRIRPHAKPLNTHVERRYWCYPVVCYDMDVMRAFVPERSRRATTICTSKPTFRLWPPKQPCGAFALVFHAPANILQPQINWPGDFGTQKSPARTRINPDILRVWFSGIYVCMCVRFCGGAHAGPTKIDHMHMLYIARVLVCVRWTGFAGRLLRKELKERRLILAMLQSLCEYKLRMC